MPPDTDPAAPETEKVEELCSLCPVLTPGTGYGQPAPQLPTGIYRTQPRETLAQDCEHSPWPVASNVLAHSFIPQTPIGHCPMPGTDGVAVKKSGQTLIFLPPMPPPRLYRHGFPGGQGFLLLPPSLASLPSLPQKPPEGLPIAHFQFCFNILLCTGI